MFNAKKIIGTLPELPGVYQMLNSANEIIYVGKAKNLKNRVTSYFHKLLDSKTQALVSNISDIKITITNNEKEALLLEQTLIKNNNPKYNIVLRDDKSYPFIYLSKDPFARLNYHRGSKKAPGDYYGPYPSSYAVRQTINLMQKIFKLRSCTNDFFNNRTRPCLQYQIKRCTAPCVGYITHEEYKEDLRRAVLFLKGKESSLIADLVSKMQTCSDNQQYERAAILRDQIIALRHVCEQQGVIDGKHNIDVLAVLQSKGIICVHIIVIRNGYMLGSKSLFPKSIIAHEDAEILHHIIAQYYLYGQGKLDAPSIILVDELPTQANNLKEALCKTLGKNISISNSARDKKGKWLQMANKNVAHSLAQRVEAKSTISKRLSALQEILGLDRSIELMECFDISHTQGEATVGSCVVFDKDGPLKKRYRSYNISEGGSDDYQAMHETLERHYAKLKTQSGTLPEVVFVDGGKGQLSRALEVLESLQLYDLIVVAVAKGPLRKAGLETLYIAHDINSEVLELHLPMHHAALHLIQHIRDEAHRFAITRHRKQRAKTRQTSILEQVPGIGKKRCTALLNHFGGLRELKGASIEGLASVPGISLKSAKLIYSMLHNDGE